MLIKMLVSPVVWLVMMSSILHAGSTVCDRAVDMFYRAAEVDPVMGNDEDDEEEAES